MKTVALTLAVALLTPACSPSQTSNVGPMRNALVVNYSAQEVWVATARLVFEMNWPIDVFDEGSWFLSSELMDMPSYGTSRWWDCGMRPTTTLDSESNPVNPRRTQMVSVHQVQIVPIAEDSAAVVLTMAPYRFSDVLVPCRSRGGYERLFYEQVEAALEEAAQAEDS